MIYHFTHCKASKLLALYKSRIFTGDASIAFGIKEDGLDISMLISFNTRISKPCVLTTLMLIYITAFLT